MRLGIGAVARLAGQRRSSAILTCDYSHLPHEQVRQSLHKHFNETLERVSIDEIIEYIDALGGVLALRPQPGDGSPEISWGDLFFYYAPDGVVPKSQPFATIVTKDYPDDRTSRLDRPDAFRLNISAGAAEFLNWTGHEPQEPATPDIDAGTADVVIRHPVYGSLGWLCVVNPGSGTAAPVRDLLRTAHHLARARYQRRLEASAPTDRSRP